MKKFNQRLLALLMALMLFILTAPASVLADTMISGDALHSVTFMDAEGNVLLQIFVYDGTDVTAVGDELLAGMGDGAGWESNFSPMNNIMGDTVFTLLDGASKQSDEVYDLPEWQTPLSDGLSDEEEPSEPKAKESEKRDEGGEPEEPKKKTEVEPQSSVAAEAGDKQESKPEPEVTPTEETDRTTEPTSPIDVSEQTASDPVEVPEPEKDAEQEGTPEQVEAEVEAAQEETPEQAADGEDAGQEPLLAMEERSTRRRDTRLNLENMTYLAGPMKMPYLQQRSYETKIAQYGESNISVSTSGSAATSMSMVVCYLTNNARQTPYTLMYDAVLAGYAEAGKIGHAALNYMAERNQIQYRWIGKDSDQIIKALAAGRPVIAHMGKGTFTDSEQYIVLRGLAENGRIYVSDPSSKQRSNDTYALSTIIQESETKRPFMICWADGMPTLDQEIDPEADPEIDPEANPEIDPETDPEIAPETDPEIAPEIDPEANLEVDPEADSEIDPEADPETDPEADPEIDPETDPEADPEIDPEIAPEAVPETDPEADPEIDPEIDPEEVVPEVEPETEIEPEEPSYTVSVHLVNAQERYEAGDEVVLMAVIQGTIESPTFQWQFALPEDPETWIDVEGATEGTYTFVINDDNCRHLWRVVIAEG